MSSAQPKPDRTLNVEQEEKEPDIYESLEAIQEATWYAQAYLSGIGAITAKIMRFMEGHSFDDEHTVEHISWLEISLKEKVDEMEKAIDHVQFLESEANRAKRDSRKSDQAAGA
jgi:hypothetical protein